jgi:hypothetical protein
VLQYSPELDKRIKRYQKPAKGSYRIDETYIKVKYVAYPKATFLVRRGLSPAFSD